MSRCHSPVQSVQTDIFVLPPSPLDSRLPEPSENPKSENIGYGSARHANQPEDDGDSLWHQLESTNGAYRKTNKFNRGVVSGSRPYRNLFQITVANRHCR